MDDPHRFNILFHTLPQPCCIIDSNGMVQSMNNAMQNLTGKTEVEHGPLGELGLIPQMLYRTWAALAGQQQPAYQEIADSDLLLHVNFTPLPPSDWLIMINEVSRREKAQDNPIFIMAHDMQNPLSAIKGYAELVGAFGAVNDRQALYLKRISSAVNDLSELVDNMLDVTWVDSDLPPKVAPCNLAHLVNSIVPFHALDAEQQGVQLDIEIAHIPPVMCDERRIRQVINNLIRNAIKYSPNGGDVIVSVRQESEERVQFEVIDHGIGIAPEDQTQIFDRFYRVMNETTEKIEGNGLGLSISYDILKKHGEVLCVESTPGEGSRFYFSLPTV